MMDGGQGTDQGRTPVTSRGTEQGRTPVTSREQLPPRHACDLPCSVSSAMALFYDDALLDSQRAIPVATATPHLDDRLSFGSMLVTQSSSGGLKRFLEYRRRLESSLGRSSQQLPRHRILPASALHSQCPQWSETCLFYLFI